MALVPARLLGRHREELRAGPGGARGGLRVRPGSSAATTRARSGASRPRTSQPSQEPTGTGSPWRRRAGRRRCQQVTRAASRDEARPILTGVLLEVSREGLTMVATDSYRLAVRELAATAEGEAKALVPERALTEAGRAAGGDEKAQAELFIDQSQVAFRIGRAHPDLAAHRGRVPELPPAAARGLREPADRHRASSCWTRSAGWACWPGTSSPVKMEFNALGVRLSSSSPDLGGAVEVVEADVRGDGRSPPPSTPSTSSMG